jgi:uncharacterized protein YxeA
MKKILLLIITQLILAGCSLQYIDAPISAIVATNNLIWEKYAIDNGEKNTDLVECAQLYSKKYNQFGSNYSYFVYNICMIKKGYRFVPKPNGFPDQCEFKHNAVGCALAKGEIYLDNQGRVVWRKTGEEARVDDF